MLVHYLISTFAGQVMLDKSGDLRPWGRQGDELYTSALQFNSFPGQEEVLLNIPNDVFSAEFARVVGWEA